ncbi:GntR family transcriptional regulator [Pseudomonas sp. GD03842]|uniref:GntR family transcriptional regulator n=1 Tax=unclassified Pseudomonas TaxID=196821 RepID=UPI000D3C599D|nr:MULTISPECIES: GntR family transcriptional regulator [unclassified Pseudomonas]MDH0745015.1 GntR family transcriptional regulator [Pseudomonas sp. GD03842]RAU48126.1 GntR family transcriptional regulator [Pseudomonas sp. RIT 409]RAU55176.1 GntR family transcriptional regulator [Pseudomonas sp. RIT 412]
MKVLRQASSLRHQVQDALRNEIISGRFKPGDRLVEQQLYTALDVSRTSLREALRQLEAEGLVEQVPHRGAYVASVDAKDAVQIYDVRGALEVLAVRNFVRHATDEDVGELVEVFDEFEQQSHTRCVDGTALLDIKRRFYHVLLDIEQSRVVGGMLEQLNNRVSLLRALSLGREGRMPHTLAELKEIVRNIERRDEEGACAAALLHVANASKNVLALLAENGGHSGE